MPTKKTNFQETSIIEAFGHLNLNPNTASLKDVNKIKNKTNLQKLMTKELKYNSPIKNDISNKEILAAYKNKSLQWRKYKQEYSIYFEQKIKKLNISLSGCVLLNIMADFGFYNLYIKMEESQSINTILSNTALTGSIITLLIIIKLLNDKNNKTLKLFNVLQKKHSAEQYLNNIKTK